MQAKTGRKEETVAPDTASVVCPEPLHRTPRFISVSRAMSKPDASDGIPAAEAPAKRPPLNKYALACAILASMNSILLGYGTHTTKSHAH